jgi:hypothetical protein
MLVVGSMIGSGYLLLARIWFGNWVQAGWLLAMCLRAPLR